MCAQRTRCKLRLEEDVGTCITTNTVSKHPLYLEQLLRQERGKVEKLRGWGMIGGRVSGRHSATRSTNQLRVEMETVVFGRSEIEMGRGRHLYPSKLRLHVHLISCTSARNTATYTLECIHIHSITRRHGRQFRKGLLEDVVFIDLDCSPTGTG